jgi:serine/threonine protein kinase
MHGPDADGPMPVAKAVSYGIRIATALQEVHHKGIVVSSLKPSKILLSEIGEPVLADFSTSATVVSTKGVDPETCTNDAVDFR